MKHTQVRTDQQLINYINHPVLLQHQSTVFFSHTTPAAASSHQPAISVFLSHHSSSSLQHQYSEQGD